MLLQLLGGKRELDYEIALAVIIATSGWSTKATRAKHCIAAKGYPVSYGWGHQLQRRSMSEGKFTMTYQVEPSNSRAWTEEQMDALFAGGFPAFITADCK